jgi:antirestriction protein ArdC
MRRRGTHQYAAEELVAEFGKGFLSAHLDISSELRHADYIASSPSQG